MTLSVLTPDDVPPAGSDDTAPLRCAVEGCENTLTYSGRGRRPTKCDEHKATPTPAVGTRAKWPNADAVEKVILGYLNGLGVAVTWINPADGRVIAKGNPAVARALVNLGRADKQWRKWLDRITQPGKYGELVVALFPIVIGIAANHQLLPQFVIPVPTDETEGGTAND